MEERQKRQFLKMEYYLNEFARIYFVLAIILTAIAFFNPLFATIAICVLLTGAVWVLVDSCGGIVSSFNFLSSRGYEDKGIKNYKQKNLHLINLILCSLMFFAALFAIFLPAAHLWLSIFFIFFGCSMWIPAADNLMKNDWRDPDKVEHITIDTSAWALGGLGGVLFAIFFGFNLPYAVGLAAVICYFLAAPLKLGQFIYNLRYGKIMPDLQSLEKLPLLDNKNDLVTNKVVKNSDTFDIDLSSSNEHGTYFKYNDSNPLCVRGFEILLNFARLILDRFSYSCKINESKSSLSCISDQGDEYSHQLIQKIVAKAAIKFQLGPIKMSGGDASCLFVAVRSAFELGFTNIVIKPSDKLNPEYEKLINLVDTVRVNFKDHDKILAKVGQDGDVTFLKQSIEKCLDPEQRDFFLELMSGNNLDSKQKPGI
jgi:hypothetical protein